MYSV
ncbi:hypothetical protein VCHC62A1_1701A, partial [Vibrio cholerae HC-62A1]|jgi:hypothetical protein